MIPYDYIFKLKTGGLGHNKGTNGGGFLKTILRLENKVEMSRIKLEYHFENKDTILRQA